MGEPPQTESGVIQAETTRFNSLSSYLKIVIIILALIGISLSVMHVFSLSIGKTTILTISYYYALYAVFASSAFLILPARKKDKDRKLPWYDLVAFVLTLAICTYFFAKAWEISQVGWIPAQPLHFAMALILCISIIEAGRRMGGIGYVIVCLVLGAYPLFSEHMPGALFAPSLNFWELISFDVFGSAGIIGIPGRVVGGILIGFLIFAGILVASGAGKFFLDLALSIFGKFRGGPAKVAVVASGFFGSLSGSIFSNVVATGSVTIPAMKRTGYPPHYAGAIEACASTGGMLMPPVMGAVAFVMAVFLGVDYGTVVVAAAIPAILYYWGLLMQVDAYAARVNMKGLDPSEIPSFRQAIKKGWPFVVTLAFLIWGLVFMKWSTATPYYASGLMIVLSFFSKETRMTPRKIFDIMASVSKLIIQTVAIILPIGFIICGLIVTGASASLTSALVSIGEGNIYLLLILGCVICYIFGMIGLVTPAYIFLAVSLAPAIMQVGGISEMAIHLFLIYYAMLASITPPVAIAAFLAATMAGASPMRTAFQAMRLGVVIYFIPFFFVFNPSLILQGSGLEALYLFVLCLVGIVLIAGGMEGYLVFVGRVNIVTRPLLVIAGFLIGFPEWKTTIAGAIIAAVIIIYYMVKEKGRVTS